MFNVFNLLQDGWTSFVGAVVPDQHPDKEYAAFLCSCISAKQRKLYTLVTYQGLIEEVSYKELIWKVYNFCLLCETS